MINGASSDANTIRAMLVLMEERGLDVVYRETDRTHTWINRQQYLNEFAPQLFRWRCYWRPQVLKRL